MSAPQHILVPVDFTPGSEAALVYATDLAEKTGASVDIIHVLNVPSYVMPDAVSTLAEGLPPSVVPDAIARDHAEKQMQSALEIIARHGIEHANCWLASGDIESAILSLASRNEYDLLVIGTHGATRFQRLMLESMAEKMVRLAPCPVLTLRSAHTEHHG